MDRSLDSTAPIPHRLLPFYADGIRIKLATDRMVEQESCTAKSFKRSFLDEPMLVETAKKCTANNYRVRRIVLGRLIEVL